VIIWYEVNRILEHQIKEKNRKNDIIKKSALFISVSHNLMIKCFACVDFFCFNLPDSIENDTIKKYHHYLFLYLII
jgi:hypothetical protein